MSKSQYLPRNNRTLTAEIYDWLGSDMREWISERVSFMSDPSDGGHNSMRRTNIKGLGAAGVEELGARTVYFLVGIADRVQVKTGLNLSDSYQLVIDCLLCDKRLGNNGLIEVIRRAYGPAVVRQAFEIIQEVDQ